MCAITITRKSKMQPMHILAIWYALIAILVSRRDGSLFALWNGIAESSLITKSLSDKWTKHIYIVPFNLVDEWFARNSKAQLWTIELKRYDGQKPFSKLLSRGLCLYLTQAVLPGVFVCDCSCVHIVDCQSVVILGKCVSSGSLIMSLVLTMQSCE